MKRKIKDKVIRIRVSDKEYKLISNLALELGYKTISEFTRVSLIGNNTKKKSDCMKSDSMSYHLSRIGNNLNQLAYVLNKSNLKGCINDELVDEMMKELMYANVLLEKIDSENN